MATGEIRAAFSLSEPELGSDVQAIKTSAKKVDDGAYEINGQKMWVTNGLRSTLVFTLVKTDPSAEPRYKGMTCFICEKEPGVAENTGDHAGLTVPPQIKKMGYKGVESTELVFDGYRTPADSILGGEEAGLGKGFGQMMDALELGRVNVAARGVGIAQRALELALRYSQERKTFGKPIAEHQATPPGCSPSVLPGSRTPANARTLRRAWPSCSPQRQGGSALRSAFASTGAMATPRSTKSSGCTATHRCC